MLLVRRVRLAGRAATVVVALATVGGALAAEGLPFVLLDALRPQWAWLAGAATLGLAFTRSPRFSLAAAILTAFHLTAVVPPYFGRSPEVPPGPRLDVLFANVEQDNRGHGAFLDVVTARDPDVLALVETDARWLEALEPLTGRYPHHLLEPRPDRFGMALLSRWPLDDAQVMATEPAGRPILVATVAVPGARPTRIVVAHPPPPVSNDLLAERDATIPRVGEEAASHEGPVVLAGDLNAPPWSEPLETLLAEAELRDARDGFGALPTWPAMLPYPGRIPIDYLLVSEDVRVVDLQLAAGFGSDHRPIFGSFALPAP